MKYLVSLLMLIYSITSYCQNTERFIKVRSVRLKKTKYHLDIPKSFKIETKQGVDFIYYSIKPKKKLRDFYYAGIYLGYYPNSQAKKEDAQYLKDINLNIINDTVSFKLYKKDEKLIIEGYLYEEKHFIKTKLLQINNLQIHMFGISRNKGGINRIIGIFESIKAAD